MIMHLLLLWIHVGTLKKDNLLNTFDLLYPRFVALAIANIVILADFASSAVSLRQPNNMIQEMHNCKSSGKVTKWMHFAFNIVIEMCDTVWFIMKYNMMYQYLAYLKRRWEQGENICKVITNDLINNKYTRKVRKRVKDTNVTYLIVLGFAIVFNLATTNRTIIRTIKQYGIQIHFAFSFIVLLKLSCLTTSILLKRA